MRLIGFAWSKVASVGDYVSAFEWTGIYPFNHHNVSEYFFSISDTCETITFMVTTPPNMALLCVPYFLVTSSQNVTYLSSNFIQYSENCNSFWLFPWKKITASRVLKISPLPEIPRKYSIDKIAAFLFMTEEANNIEERRKNHGRNKVKEQRNRKFDESQYLGK